MKIDKIVKFWKILLNLNSKADEQTEKSAKFENFLGMINVLHSKQKNHE